MLLKEIKQALVSAQYHSARDYILFNYVPRVKPKPPETTPQQEKPSSSGQIRNSIEFDPYYDSENIYCAEDDDDYDVEAVDSAMSGEITERSSADLDALLDMAVKQSFVEKVIDIIHRQGVRDSAVYKAAQIDRRLFSKIMSDKNYKPAKDTAIAIALALRLSLAEATDLLERAGYTLSHSNKRDVVIEYFFRERIYNLSKINTVLEMLRFKLIGR